VGLFEEIDEIDMAPIGIDYPKARVQFQARGFSLLDEHPLQVGYRLFEGRCGAVIRSQGSQEVCREADRVGAHSGHGGKSDGQAQKVSFGLRVVDAKEGDAPVLLHSKTETELSSSGAVERP